MLAATDAIVLRSRKQGDTSKIVSLYSRDYGMVDVIAKGARQMKSKFGSALEPFTESKIVFYKKEHTELYLLSAAEIITSRRNLTSDLDHIETATRIAELLVRSQRHEECQPKLYDLVMTTLDAMNISSAQSVWAILFAFYIRYAAISGFALSIEKTTDDAARQYFDAERGEINAVHSAHDEFSDQFILLDGEMIAALRFLQKQPIESVSSLRLSDHAKHRLNGLFRSYFACHLEGMQRNRTKSERIFASLKPKT